jgi:hypothetical protein
VRVPRHITGNQDDMITITRRPLPGDCKDEEHAFRQDFDDEVVELIKDFRRQFPYRQTIQWSIEYGDDKQHSIYILVKPSQSLNN